jgi:hypothetical protein
MERPHERDLIAVAARNAKHPVDEVLTEHFLGHIRVATVFVIHVFAHSVKDDDEFAFALKKCGCRKGYNVGSRG